MKGNINLSAEDNDLPVFELLYEISTEARMMMATPKYRCAVRISSKKITDKKINWHDELIIGIPVIEGYEL